MRGRPGQARAALTSPPGHRSRIRFDWTSQAFLAPVRQAYARQRLTGNLAPGSSAHDNALALHVGHLGQHGQNQLAGAIQPALPVYGVRMQSPRLR